MIHEEFEKEAMNKLLNGDLRILKYLKEQYIKSEVSSRDLTGCGFFTKYKIPEEMVYMKIKGRVDDVKGKIINKYGEYLFFILYIENGKIDTLECFTTLDNWDYDYDNVEIEYCYDNERKIDLE